MSNFKKDILHENEDKSDVRLNRFLSDAGFCSRREADRLIEAGRVTVDGTKAELGTRVRPGQVVKVGSKVVRQNDRMVLIAFNKPRGIVCTTDRVREKNNIIDYIHYPERIYPIGRLDKDSEGLILLENSGADRANREAERSRQRAEAQRRAEEDYRLYSLSGADLPDRTSGQGFGGIDSSDE